MDLSRREFLQTSAGASLIASGLSLPAFLARTARAAPPERDARVLVVVQLSGGNDGLNTVIPFADDSYHRARPTLRIAPSEVVRLTDGLGLHPQMVGFGRMFESGRLAVINNVGYPNPDRSHFRSMDIWHTASLDPESAADGWLGRVVDLSGAGADDPPALHLDSDSLPLALRTQRLAVPSIRDVDAIRLQEGRHLAQLDASRPGESDDLLFVRRTALAACANARRLAQVAADGGASSGVAYPAYGLARRLSQIADLLCADFGPRIFYTSLGGFDTHARQVLVHGPLLAELSESVAAFFDDLAARGQADRVLLLTFSEFGRRVRENGSQGTDHGAAAPVFIAGPACAPGVHDAAPDLVNLDDGDVRHSIDFRGVYSQILDEWLGVSSEQILGRRFAAPAVIG